jgi:hypothetical protein
MKKQCCSVAFLDITQGLLFKIRKILPHKYYRTLESYVTERLFQVKFKDEIKKTLGKLKQSYRKEAS